MKNITILVVCGMFLSGCYSLGVRHGKRDAKSPHQKGEVMKRITLLILVFLLSLFSTIAFFRAWTDSIEASVVTDRELSKWKECFNGTVDVYFYKIQYKNGKNDWIETKIPPGKIWGKLKNQNYKVKSCSLYFLITKPTYKWMKEEDEKHRKWY